MNITTNIHHRDRNDNQHIQHPNQQPYDMSLKQEPIDDATEVTTTVTLLTLPGELRSAIFDYLRPTAEVSSTGIRSSCMIEYPRSKITSTPSMAPIFHPLTQVNNSLRHEAASIIYQDIHLAIQPRADYGLPTIPRCVATSIPNWAKFVNTLEVHVVLKAPKVPRPDEERTVFFDPEHSAFGWNITIVFKAGAEEGYSVETTVTDPDSVAGRVLVKEWFNEKAETLKKVVLGKLQGGTISLVEKVGCKRLRAEGGRMGMWLLDGTCGMKEVWLLTRREREVEAN
jgi:hypothetical protein